MLFLLSALFTDQIGGLNLFRYITFRSGGAVLTALIVSFVLGPRIIRWLKSRQPNVTVREDTPEAHKKKAGTPSMGGALILLAVTVSTLLFADLGNRLVWAALLVTLGFGAIGFADDYLKISKRNSKGLAGKKKLLFQVLVVLAVYYGVLTDWQLRTSGTFPWVTIGSLVDLHLTLPFVPARLFHPDMGWLYLPFMVLVVVATSNAVNLTDGLDGLAIGPTLVSSMTFMILAYLAGATIAGFSLAEYLRIAYIPGAEELGVFCSAIFGAGLAFLWYNTYPASVFMGDVGSLALGGSLGTLAVLTKNEVASAILHGVFLVETVSVILQVWSFRTTGRRIFRMAPIHHHFELKGWAEPKIIVRFWISSIMLALVALMSIKLR